MSIYCSNGECPSCRLEGKSLKLRLNRHDFFECPECRLQIISFAPVIAAILPWRGKGKFREHQVDPIVLDTCLITPAKKEGHIWIDDPSRMFSGEEQLRYFIENEVYSSEEEFIQQQLEQ